MAFPADGFASATGALASSGYSDGVLVVGLSLLPADWWNAIDTADTTKARFAVDSTEVAGWIDPDTFVNNMDGTGEGIAYVYYSSVSAVTGQVVGVAPPLAANASYAAGDTYGRNAVRAHADAWYPMTEDPSGGSILDATGNGNTGTVVGSLTSAGAAGIEFPGVNGNAIRIPNLVNGSGAWTVAARFNASDLSLIGGLGRRIFNSSGDSGNIEADLDVSSNFRAYIYQYGYQVHFIETPGPSTNTDYWAEFSWGDDGAALTVNGTEIASDASTSVISGATDSFIGGVWVQAEGQPGGAFDGIIGGVSIYPFRRSDAAKSHTYANESDPATFWGTWTWTPPPTSTIYQRRRPGVFRVGSRSVA